MLAGMDEGSPIAYEVLEEGVRVTCSDGVEVGTVVHVLAVAERDIFHGLVISTPDRGLRFVEAADIASLHERGVDLSIDAAAAADLPQPSAPEAIYDADSAGERKGWHHWIRVAERKGDWNRER